MRTFQENFDLSHRQLLETLTAYATVEAEPHLSNLCARLDFNGYYSSYCAHVSSPLVAISLYSSGCDCCRFSRGCGIGRRCGGRRHAARPGLGSVLS